MFWVYLYKAKTAIETYHRTEALWVYIFIGKHFSLDFSVLLSTALVSQAPSHTMRIWFLNIEWIALIWRDDTNFSYRPGRTTWLQPGLCAQVKLLRGAAWRVIFRGSYMSQGMKTQNVKTFLCRKSWDTLNLLDTREFWRKDSVSLLFQEDLFRWDRGQPPPSSPKQGIIRFPSLLSVECTATFIGKKLLLILITSCQE